MEAQTLQEPTPVYHVCQQCNGSGCAACSDLLILDGDIQLDPEWSDELPAVTATCKPAYEFIVVWKDNGKAFNKCFTNEADSLAHFETILGSFGPSLSTYMVYPDGQSISALPAPKADPVCSKCGKSRFDSAYGCLAPQVYSPAAGDWFCGKKTIGPSPKLNVFLDDRNIYQRREDDLRLAGEWEV